jgi:hypothetical protein
MVEKLAKALRNEEAGLRAAAALELRLLKDSRAIPPLTAALCDPVAEVRLEALEALFAIAGEESASMAVSLAASDPSAEVRVRALIGMAQHGLAEAENPLIEIARDSGFEDCHRCGAVRALEHFRTQAALKALTDALGDPNESVAEAAARSLATLRDARCAQTLVAALERGGPSQLKVTVQTLVADTLITIGQPAMPALQDALRHRSSARNPQLWFVNDFPARSIARVMAGISGPRAAPALAEYCISGGDTYVLDLLENMRWEGVPPEVAVRCLVMACRYNQAPYHLLQDQSCVEHMEEALLQRCHELGPQRLASLGSNLHLSFDEREFAKASPVIRRAGRVHRIVA